MNNYLKHGILACEWQTFRGIPYVKITPDQQPSTLPLDSSHCCLSDLTPLSELNPNNNKILLLTIRRFLVQFDFKKLTLIGYDAENSTHQDIHQILHDKNVDVKVFPTACHAKQWLLLPEIDENNWNHASVTTY